MLDGWSKRPTLRQNEGKGVSAIVGALACKDSGLGFGDACAAGGVLFGGRELQVPAALAARRERLEGGFEIGVVVEGVEQGLREG